MQFGGTTDVIVHYLKTILGKAFIMHIYCTPEYAEAM
jgi:hypothetical protein